MIVLLRNASQTNGQTKCEGPHRSMHLLIMAWMQIAQGAHDVVGTGLDKFVMDVAGSSVEPVEVCRGLPGLVAWRICSGQGAVCEAR